MAKKLDLNAVPGEDLCEELLEEVAGGAGYKTDLPLTASKGTSHGSIGGSSTKEGTGAGSNQAKGGKASAAPSVGKYVGGLGRGQGGGSFGYKP